MTLREEILNDSDGVGYSAMNSEEVSASLSLSNIPAKQAIETKKIKQYLLLVDKWLLVKNSTEVEALIAMDALNLFDELDMTNPLIADKVSQMMNGLMGKSLIDDADKVVILAMGDTLISKAELLGFPNPSAGQVQAERNT